MDIHSLPPNKLKKKKIKLQKMCMARNFGEHRQCLPQQICGFLDDLGAPLTLLRLLTPWKKDLSSQNHVSVVLSGFHLFTQCLKSPVGFSWENIFLLPIDAPLLESQARDIKHFCLYTSTSCTADPVHTVNDGNYSEGSRVLFISQ